MLRYVRRVRCRCSKFSVVVYSTQYSAVYSCNPNRMCTYLVRLYVECTV